MRSRQGVWRAWYPPMLKKRTALLRKLKDIFRRYQSQPIDRVIHLINPILRGWVRYFAVEMRADVLALSKTGWKRRCGGT